MKFLTEKITIFKLSDSLICKIGHTFEIQIGFIVFKGLFKKSVVCFSGGLQEIVSDSNADLF